MQIEQAHKNKQHLEKILFEFIEKFENEHNLQVGGVLLQHRVGMSGLVCTTGVHLNITLDKVQD